MPTARTSAQHECLSGRLSSFSRFRFRFFRLLDAQAHSVRESWTGPARRAGSPRQRRFGGWRPWRGRRREGGPGRYHAGPARGCSSACWPLIPATLVADPVRWSGSLSATASRSSPAPCRGRTPISALAPARTAAVPRPRSRPSLIASRRLVSAVTQRRLAELSRRTAASIVRRAGRAALRGAARRERPRPERDWLWPAGRRDAARGRGPRGARRSTVWLPAHVGTRTSSCQPRRRDYGPVFWHFTFELAAGQVARTRGSSWRAESGATRRHLQRGRLASTGPRRGTAWPTHRAARGSRGRGFHLNDCKGAVGCRRDRHEFRGTGASPWAGRDGSSTAFRGGCRRSSSWGVEDPPRRRLSDREVCFVGSALGCALRWPCSSCARAPPALSPPPIVPCASPSSLCTPPSAPSSFCFILAP